MIPRLSMGTAAGIAQQMSANLGRNVSRHTVSQRPSQVGLKARSLATKPLINKTHKIARLAFAEEHVTWTDDS